MSSTVGDVCYQVQVFAFRPSEKPVHRIDYDLDEVYIFPFVESPDVVGVPDSSLVEDEVDGSGVVFHVEPVADVESLPIDRQRLAAPYVVDEQRDEFFRKLVRTIVVRAVGHYCRKSVGVVECPDKVV